MKLNLTKKAEKSLGRCPLYGVFKHVVTSGLLVGYDNHTAVGRVKSEIYTLSRTPAKDMPSVYYLTSFSPPEPINSLE